MRRNERKVLKNNAGLVDMLFELLFEKLWVAPFDRRREDPALHEFERVARRLVVSLGDTDLAVVSAARAGELLHMAQRLAVCVVRIEEAGLFPSPRCAEAAAVVRSLTDQIRSACGNVIAG